MPVLSTKVHLPPPNQVGYGILPAGNLKGKTLCSENAAVFGILGLVLKINLIEKICFLF